MLGNKRIHCSTIHHIALLLKLYSVLTLVIHWFSIWDWHAKQNEQSFILYSHHVYQALLFNRICSCIYSLWCVEELGGLLSALTYNQNPSEIKGLVCEMHVLNACTRTANRHELHVLPTHMTYTYCQQTWTTCTTNTHVLHYCKHTSTTNKHILPKYMYYTYCQHTCTTRTENTRVQPTHMNYMYCQHTYCQHTCTTRTANTHELRVLPTYMYCQQTWTKCTSNTHVLHYRKHTSTTNKHVLPTYMYYMYCQHTWTTRTANTHVLHVLPTHVLPTYMDYGLFAGRLCLHINVKANN